MDNLNSSPCPTELALPASIDERKRAELRERLLACFQKALGHELPNLLIAIQGLVQVLHVENGDHLSEDGRDYLNRLSTAAQRAHALVQTLAALGRWHSQQPSSEPVAIAEVAREAVVEVNQLYPRMRIEYHFLECASMLTLPRVTLRQVLVQLLRNAAQAAIDGTAHIEIGARNTDTGLAFWVADHGRGISMDQLNQLFEPFCSGLGRSGAGMGIGLFMVRQFVESWGGRISVQSAPGQGATFTIEVDTTMS